MFRSFHAPKKNKGLFAPNSFSSFNAEGGFQFFDLEQKYEHLESDPKFLNMKLLEKLVNGFLLLSLKESLMLRKLNAIICQILNKLFEVLRQFGHEDCEHLQINSRNVILQNLFKGYGILSEVQEGAKREKTLNKCLEILLFLQDEVLGTKGDLFTPKKHLNLKTLLNICVCLYEFMSPDHWSVALQCFVRFCSQNGRVKSHDLEDFHLMRNSIQSLFLASQDFPVLVLCDFLAAIKKLLVGDVDYTRRIAQVLNAKTQSTAQSLSSRMSDFFSKSVTKKGGGGRLTTAQPEGISAEDGRELLDYLIKIVDNNYERISEIWNPVEMVVMGYVEHCIVSQEKQKNRKKAKGRLGRLIEEQKRPKAGLQMAALKWILTKLLGLIITKNTTRKKRARKRSASTDKDGSMTSQDTRNSEEPAQKVGVF